MHLIAKKQILNNPKKIKKIIICFNQNFNKKILKITGVILNNPKKIMISQIQISEIRISEIGDNLNKIKKIYKI